MSVHKHSSAHQGNLKAKRATPTGNQVEYRDEEKGKDSYRYAFAYAEKIERYIRHAGSLSDVFQPEIVTLRAKLQKKCQEVLFLSCSKRRKAEELLWKHVVYGVISQSKQHREVLNPSHPCHNLYNSHLINATVYYQQLLQDLQDHYNIHITRMSSHQLEEMETSDRELIDGLWLKEATQRCFIYLGDIARYQVELGFSPEHAVAFYQQAIVLDSGNGAPYNQLAALSESQNNYFDAIFYYLRSMTAPKPFPGVERNFDRLIRKNYSHLSKLESSKETIMEQQLPQFKKELLLCRFLQLQDMFISSPRSTGGEKGLSAAPTPLSVGSSDPLESLSVSELCSVVSSLFEECLDFDLQLYAEECPPIASKKLGKQVDSPANNPSPPVLDDGTLLKFCSLSFLPAYNLRLKGSSDTLLACAFAFSVLSNLLLSSYKKLLCLTIEAAKQNSTKGPSASLPDYHELLESNDVSIVKLLQENSKEIGLEGDIPGQGRHMNATSDELYKSSTDNDQASHLTFDPRRKRDVGIDKRVTRADTKKPLKKRQVDRRRRRRGRGERDSDSNSSSTDDDSGHIQSHPDSDSDSDTSISLIEDIGISDKRNKQKLRNIDVIDSLSESDSPDSDRDIKPRPPPEPSPVLKAEARPKTPPSKGRTRRQFNLAATFSLAPQGRAAPSQSLGSNVIPTSDKTLSEDINELQVKTDHELAVQLACTLLNDEPTINSIKVMMDWLLSYPVVIATYGKSCNDTIWSRLADLLNFIPSLKTLHSSGLVSDSCLSSFSCSDWTQTSPLPEDKTLRGFSPLLRTHQSIDFTASDSSPSNIPQVVNRIKCFIKFGHFIATSKSVPLFEYDSVNDLFIGPAQRKREEAQAELMRKEKFESEAKSNRSKLMKLMAQQRLKAEVKSLSEASAKTQGVLFTPYLLPDAQTLCHNLHLVKKLMKTQNFVIIIAKSVIESLDLLKKEKSNFAAREAIKFLETEFQEGNKFLRAQNISETADPHRKRSRNQDINVWLFDGLIDCALYYNTDPSTTTTGLSTLLIDKYLYDRAFEGKRRGSGSRETDSVLDEKASLLMTASQNGIEISTILNLYKRWQRNGQT